MLRESCSAAPILPNTALGPPSTALILPDTTSAMLNAAPKAAQYSPNAAQQSSNTAQHSSNTASHSARPPHLLGPPGQVPDVYAPETQIAAPDVARQNHLSAYGSPLVRPGAYHSPAARCVAAGSP